MANGGVRNEKERAGVSDDVVRRVLVEAEAANAPRTGGSRTVQALQTNAADQEAEALRIARREAGIQAMAMSRQKVISALAGKEKAILYHLDEHIPETIAQTGQNPDTLSYWRKELGQRLGEMERLTEASNLGSKSSAEWRAKVAELRGRVVQLLGEE
jgi:hypothetical protein